MGKEGKLKKLLLAGLALGALALGAPTANADHPEPDYYSGGCSFATVNDTTPNQALGGQNSWNGEIDILARTNDGGDPAVPTNYGISVRCDLQKNGSLFVSAAAEASGSGVVAAAARIQFTAEATDVITVCQTVTVDTPNGSVTTTHCVDAETTPLVPEPVQEIIGTVIDKVNEGLALIDPTICPYIAEHAGTYGPVEIDSGGDIYVYGELWWDCPPYVVTP